MAIEQIQRHPDGLYYVVVPTRHTMNYLLEAHGVNGVTVEVRSLGRPPWKHTLTGEAAAVTNACCCNYLAA
jgi:hypothetical protein